jgi:uncharacterized membrane protein
MKPSVNFLRATLTGGILFLLPTVLLVMILTKAYAILYKISAPLAKVMPEIILGLDGSNLLSILLLIVICFVSGLLFRSGAIRRLISGLEESVLSYLPGYTLIKSIASDAIGDTTTEKMATVLVKDEDSWNIGFLVEEDNDFCTVFFPEAPRHDSGEVKIVPASTVKKIDVAANKTSRSLKSYGKGALQWINK